MQQEYAQAPRDRIANRLRELARLLNKPGNVPVVQAELERLANG